MTLLCGELLRTTTYRRTDAESSGSADFHGTDWCRRQQKPLSPYSEWGDRPQQRARRVDRRRQRRRRNLGRVLRLVHLDGPLSRAALTEATGLNRSTIADLVGELVALSAWCRSGPPTRPARRPALARRGGAPPVVAIAVNPEVDALTIAAVGLDRRIRCAGRIEIDRLHQARRRPRDDRRAARPWRADELADARDRGHRPRRARDSCAPRTDSCATPRTCAGPTSPCASWSFAATGLPDRPSATTRCWAPGRAPLRRGARHRRRRLPQRRCERNRRRAHRRRDAGGRRLGLLRRVRAEPARHRRRRRSARRRRRARGRGEPRPPARRPASC